RGHTGSNWSVLEANSLIQNSLAINSPIKRDSLLRYYLEEGSARQDALPIVAEEYPYEGSVYPETSQYSISVAARTTRMMVVLNKYAPGLNLGRKYDNIPLSLDRWNHFRYPNGELIRFGDGKRRFDEPYEGYEAAYLLGRLDSVPKLRKKFGSLIRSAVENDDYSRGTLGVRSYGASEYYEPTTLLWYEGEVKLEGANRSPELPRTDALPHAGLILQRNLSSTGNPDDGLMAFVGGAHYVHAHASGMDMELYGEGQVLGVDNGRGSYRTDLHENYSRLFAAHNTVIVNGASQGEGGWVNLGIDTVKLVTMEPAPFARALSPNYSFSTTSFKDDRGEGAEAYQERTLALVRTSPTSGYYVDVFRSRSDLPDEFHDYVYHNLGDGLNFQNTDLELRPDPERYRAQADAEWKRNRKYRNPGWHFFDSVQTSKTYTKPVRALFELKELAAGPIFMGLHIPGFGNLEYTKVMAPNTFEAPHPYDKKPTPTLLIRNKGQAWTNPFVVVFEPYGGNSENRTVRSVEKLERDGTYQGLKITSEVAGDTLVQYVITPEGKNSFSNKEMDLSFTGKFAIVTFEGKPRPDGTGQLRDVYIGDGNRLRVGNVVVTMGTYSKSAYVDFTGDNLTINGNASVKVLEK
ncbi:MAG: heparinase II/III family protein, partial [Pricia sp.]